MALSKYFCTESYYLKIVGVLNFAAFAGIHILEIEYCSRVRYARAVYMQVFN